MLRLATLLAKQIEQATGKTARIAAIGTEFGALEKYLGEKPDGIPFDFDICELDSFAPTEYTGLIEDAGRNGYAIVVIDSLSHAWSGKGGALEIKDQSKDKNQYTAWRDVTPMHTRMIDSILQSPCHVFASLRSKTEYIMEKNAEGKTVPLKVGTEPIQRAGMEYEFDIFAEMDAAHILKVSKSRCSAIQDLMMSKPGPALAHALGEWISTGTVGEVAGAVKRLMITDDQTAAAAATFDALGWTSVEIAGHLAKVFGVGTLGDLTVMQAAEMIVGVEKELTIKRKKDAMKAKRATPSGTEATTDAPPTTPTNQAMKTPATAETPPVSAPSEAGGSPAIHDNHEINQPLPDGGGVTVGQMERIITLKGLMESAKGIGGSEAFADDRRALWAKCLSPFGVASAKALTAASAKRLIKNLEKDNDFPPAGIVSPAPGGAPANGITVPQPSETIPTESAQQPVGT